MNNESADRVDSGQDSVQAAGVRRMSSEAVARRRLLLRGTTAGATVVAALTPFGALGTSQSTVYTCIGKDGNEGLCTLSGVQSAAHSFGPGTVKVPAVGKSPGWWGQSVTVSKKTMPRREWPVDWQAKVGNVLTLAPHNLKQLTLFKLMSDSAYANTAERHWLCAYLNAKAGEQGMFAPGGFPYSATDVITFYLTSNADAYSFFTTYLEM